MRNSMIATAIAMTLASPAETAQGDGATAEAAEAGYEKAVGKELPLIISVADQMNKQHGAFQRALFSVIRKSDNREFAASLLNWVELKTCEHFSAKAHATVEGTNGKLLPDWSAWGALTAEDRAKKRIKLNAIDGLSSWGAVKSKLLAGYAVQVKIGNKDTVCAHLNPTMERYRDADGVTLWVQDIEKARNEAIAKHNEEVARIAAAKIAEAGSTQHPDSHNTGTNADGTKKTRGHSIEMKLPDVVDLKVAQFTRVVQEVAKAAPEDEVLAKAYNTALAGIIGRCVDEMARLQVGEADRVRKMASDAGRTGMTKEAATERLNAMRALQAIEPEVDEATARKELNEALAQVDAETEATTLDDLDTEVIEQDDSTDQQAAAV